MGTIAFNPQLTTQPNASFLANTRGYVQGAFFDDPSSRMWLVSGVVSSAYSGSFIGGMAISETLNAYSNTGTGLGLNIAPAANNASITGFSTNNQAYNMTIVPGNTVPVSTAGMTANYFRLGSNARIAVQCSATLMTAVAGGLTTQQVSWDFVNNMLVPYTPGYAANTITGAVWASTNGGQITFTVSTNPTTLVFAGDNINVSGVVNTGGASTTAFNGVWVVTSTSATTIVVSAPASASIGTYASGGTVNAAQGGVLNVKLLSVNGNSKIVNTNQSTGALTWASGNAAIIQI